METQHSIDPFFLNALYGCLSFFPPPHTTPIANNMPRSSRSSGGSRAAPSGARGAHTMSHPPPAAHHAPPPPAQPVHVQQQGPGLFGQMASTAAGVAVGSTVGHGLSNMLFGGGGSAEPAPAPAAQQQAYQQPAAGVNCDAQSKDFIKCLESSKLPPITLSPFSYQRLTNLPSLHSQRHELVLLLPRAAQGLPGCRPPLLGSLLDASHCSNSNSNHPSSNHHSHPFCFFMCVKRSTGTSPSPKESGVV